MVRRNVFDVGFEHFPDGARSGGLPHETPVGWVAPGRGGLSGIFDPITDIFGGIQQGIFGALETGSEQAAGLIGARVREAVERFRRRIAPSVGPGATEGPSQPRETVKPHGYVPRFEGPRRFSVPESVVSDDSEWPAWMPAAARNRSHFVYVMGEGDDDVGNTDISKSISRLKKLNFLSDARAVDTMTESVVNAVRQFQSAAGLTPTGQLDIFTYYRINHEAYLADEGRGTLTGTAVAGTPAQSQTTVRSSYRQPTPSEQTTQEKADPDRHSITSLPGFHSYLMRMLRVTTQPDIPKPDVPKKPSPSVAVYLVAAFLIWYFVFREK